MALLFIDGFDHYTTLTTKWTAVNVSRAIVAGGRTGSALQCNFSGEYVSATVLGGISTVLVGFATKTTALPAAWTPFVAVGSATTFAVCVGVNADGTLRARRATNAAAIPGDGSWWTNIGTDSANALSSGAWVYIEVRFVVDDSAGEVTVRVNGTEWLAVTSADTLFASATLTRVALGAAYDASAGTYFDDVYVASSSGGAVTDFLGDCTVEALLPQTDAVDPGTHTAWTCNTGTDHGALVDDATPDGDTTYVYAATNVKDSWKYPDLSVANATIYGVQVATCAKKSDTGTGEFKTLARGTPGRTQG